MFVLVAVKHRRKEQTNKTRSITETVTKNQCSIGIVNCSFIISIWYQYKFTTLNFSILFFIDYAMYKHAAEKFASKIVNCAFFGHLNFAILADKEWQPH